MASGTASLKSIFDQCREMDAPLTERLAAFADVARKQNPAFTDAVDRLVARLQQSGAGQDAPQVGDPMPPFLLPDDMGRLRALDDFLRQGPVALTFHRGHWCPYCRINLYALAVAHRDVAPEGGQIAAILPERQQFATEFKTDAHAEFPLLIDMDNGYAMSLGLAFWIGEEMKQLMQARGDRGLAEYQGNDAWLLPIPATFIVGRDGLIKARFIDPDYRKRMDIDELQQALRQEI